MKGSTLLKVISTLFIVDAAFNLIIRTIILFSAMCFNAGKFFTIYAVPVVELLAGIAGFTNCKKPEKAQICIVFSIIAMALLVIVNVILPKGDAFFDYFTTIISFIAFILYLIGAICLKSNLNTSAVGEHLNENTDLNL